MRVLVTGREGQVARSLAVQCPAGTELVFAARPEMDLTDAASIRAAVAAAAPDAIVSAAAYTAVDKAESEPELALAVNGVAPGILAECAARRGIPMLHLSTDYVFDGTLDRPYREDDPVAPLGVYGRTKLAGEVAVAASGADYAIVRTAWVYSPFGNNFVRTMLRLAETRDRVGVVADQIGCPTSALDIADALLALLAGWRAGVSGIYHYAGSDAVSWAAFAEAIFSEQSAHGRSAAAVDQITTADYPTAAPRPANSRLACSAIAQQFGIETRALRRSLATTLAAL